MSSNALLPAALTVALILWPTGPVSAGVDEPVVPFLSCLAQVEEPDTVVAFFGYSNPNPGPVSLGIGGNNFFIPTPSDRGQPTDFEPGLHPRAFHVVFNPGFEQSVQWNLDGSSATASLSGAPFCHSATLSLAVSGSGTISASPGVPSCPDACSSTFDGPTELQLDATPDPGWSFAGYAGDADCTDGEVTLGAGSLVSCQAVFEPPIDHALAVAVFGDGSVTASLGGIDCPFGPCYADLPEGSSVGLTAWPALGSAFLGWTGDPDCTDGMVTLDAPRVCSAAFAPTAIFSDDFETGDTSAWMSP